MYAHFWFAKYSHCIFANRAHPCLCEQFWNCGSRGEQGPLLLVGLWVKLLNWEREEGFDPNFRAQTSLVAQTVKSLLAMGSIPGSESSPGEWDGYALQYPCLENPKDGGAWQATVHGVAKSRT